MLDPHAYNITIRRGTFGGEVCYEARIKEFPDLTEYADSPEEAYALAIDALETTAKVFVEKGKSMPIPQSPADDYSGRVTLRLPKSLHRALAEVAAAEDISLNQHLVNILSYYSGYAAGVVQESRVWQPVPDKRKQKSECKTHL